MELYLHQYHSSNFTCKTISMENIWTRLQRIVTNTAQNNIKLVKKYASATPILKCRQPLFFIFAANSHNVHKYKIIWQTKWQCNWYIYIQEFIIMFI